jgi:hypothetical protein
VKSVTPVEILCPQPNFLCQSGIIGFCPIAKLQAEVSGGLFEPCNHRLDFLGRGIEQRFQRKPLLRCVWMERKGFPFYRNIKLFFQFINTPGNEIAPGSDIVRENSHFFLIVSHKKSWMSKVTMIYPQID